MVAANDVRDGNGGGAEAEAGAEPGDGAEEAAVAEVRLAGETCELRDLLNPPHGHVVNFSYKAALRFQV